MVPEYSKYDVGNRTPCLLCLLLFWVGTCTHIHEQGVNKERQSEPAVNSSTVVTSAQGSVPRVCTDPGQLCSPLAPLVLGRTRAANRRGPRERVLLSSALRKGEAVEREVTCRWDPL